MTLVNAFFYQERDSYKSVLESYEHEITFNGATFEKDRVNSLEQSLQNYKETVERLEDLLAAERKATFSKDSDTEADLRSKLKETEEKLSQLEAENAELRSQASISNEGPSPSGSYKVLHMKDNPLSGAIEDRRQEVEGLRAEITSLRARIKLLEEGQTRDLTLLVGNKVTEDEGTSVKGNAFAS